MNDKSAESARGSNAADDGKDVTRLLADFHSGRDGAIDRLLPAVYAELRQMAARYLDRERNAKTMQPTMLVNDALMQLMGAELPPFQDRAHFFGFAARSIRQALVSHAREKGRMKRGGGAARVTLHTEMAAGVSASPLDLLDFESALEALTAENANFGRMVELRFYGGLEVGEVAEILGVSKSTVERGLRVARAFLTSRLMDGADGKGG